MLKHIALLAVPLFVAGCPHNETLNACRKIACGGDVSGCISEDEENLGEIGVHCGDAGTKAALAVYTCEATLDCNNKSTFTTACAQELAAYNQLRTSGGPACKSSPDVVAP
jgi:hypothetical protein